MTSSVKMCEDMIAEYISSVDVSGEFSVKSIKENLKRMLGEEPALKINWVKDTPLFEGGVKTNRKIERVQSIFVTFSHGEDANGNPNVYTVEILK